MTRNSNEYLVPMLLDMLSKKYTFPWISWDIFNHTTLCKYNLYWLKSNNEE